MDVEVVKAGEAAQMLCVCTQTLRNWDSAGRLKPYQVLPSGHRRYSREQLEQFIQNEELIKEV
jgi:DNA-binding transcriptional MerR regulator